MKVKKLVKLLKQVDKSLEVQGVDPLERGVKFFDIIEVLQEDETTVLIVVSPNGR